MIIVYEIIGFILILVLLWLNEVADIPHYIFGASSTPINWTESFIETFYVTILGILVILVSLNHLKRIKTLEGFLSICSFCKKIHVVDTWVPFEKYIQDHSKATFTHGICPECAKKHYSEYYEKEKM